MILFLCIVKIFVVRPFVTRRGDVDDIGIRRMDHDSRNRVRPRETHVLPRLSRVGGLEHAGASMGTTEDICLAGPYPHYAGIGRGDRDVTN